MVLSYKRALPFSKNSFLKSNLKVIFFFICFSAMLIQLDAQVTVISEDFTGQVLPTGWSNIDNGSSGQIWQFTDPGNRAVGSPFDSDFAMVDSDTYGNGNSQNATLESPGFDASVFDLSLTLKFDYQYRECCSSTAIVEVFNGTTWSTVATYTGNPNYVDNTSVTSESIDILSAAGSATNAKVRFTYTGSFAWWFALDNFEVEGTANPHSTATCDNNTELGGVVFNDVNFDGVCDAGEDKVSGVSVSLYDNNGQVGSTIQTDNDGKYLFTGLTVGATYRVEFTVPTGMEVGPQGTDSKTAIQFAPAGTCDNSLGIQAPDCYCDADPYVIVPCYVEGAYNGTYTAEAAIAKVLESADGHDFTGTTKTGNYEASLIATHGQVGSVYGIAWQNTTSRYYAAAFHKRYIGFGPDGPDAIYQLDLNGNVTGSIELDDLLPGSNTAGSDIHDFTPSGGHVYDLGTGDEVFDGVGKRSFGDIEISEDGTTLYVVNLFDRKIYALDVTDGNTSNVTITTSWNAPDATGASRHRPFGLAIHDGKLWIGSVDEDGTDAYIHSLDPSGTTFNLELTIDMSYARQAYMSADANTVNRSAEWRAWATNTSITPMASGSNEIAYPQAMLSDIEFATDSSMILGFRDRFGDQTGGEKRFNTAAGSDSWGTTAGDILKACYNSGSFIIETGNSGGCSGTGGITDSGPGGVEFYHWDAYNFDNATWNPNSATGMFHWETTQGGLLQLKGRSYVMTTAMDPFHDFSGGMIKLDNSTGGREGIGTGSSTYGNLTGGYTMFETGDWGTGPPTNNGTLSKANGLGDLEAACSAVPLEIGDFVWIDTDADGIQDPSESGLSGATVILTDGNDVVIATTITDSNGKYAFNNSNVVGGLSFNTTYKVKVSIGNAQAIDPTVGSTSPQNTGNGENDNDAILVGSDAVVTFTTGASGEINHSIDIGFAPSGIVGNRIWVDENTNGIQDAGEPGIGNVVVELQDGTCTSGLDCPTTITDAKGGYVFKNVTVGNYTVVVLSGVPSGMNPIYDEDDGTTSPNMTASISVGVNEYVTGDFGYNYVSKADTDNPSVMTATGAIGNRIWNDANGDGNQDGGESGIANITVELWTDADQDGVYTASGTTTTTDEYGNYIFDNVTPGAYVLNVVSSGLTSLGFTTAPTGDPDGDADNTSEPIIIAPGDVWLGGDFGYNSAGNPADIGSTVFVDVDGNGSYSAVNDLPLEGVTVSLISDTNNDGDQDSNERVVATTTTAADGSYLFPDLADGNYVVLITDVNNVIGNLENSIDPDGSNDGYSQVNLSGTDELSENFGYVPIGHVSGEGFIGNFIFHDADGGGDYDAGESGIEGIEVQLLDDGSSNVLAKTLTDENGMYFFGGLADGDYRVRVNSSTIPSGMETSVDPDGSAPADEEGATVSISSGSSNLTQDFGYKAITAYLIAGTIWEDANAEGTLDGTETTRFQGVTIDLLDANGNVVSSTTTAANGTYSFDNIPDGTYTIEVTDETTELSDKWHSLGSDSENDPVQIIVSGSNITGIDFGYYDAPAAIGNYVWDDNDGDGIQDSGETGIEDVVVTLEIDYNNDATTDVTVVTTTDNTGFYSFENLLLDEDINSSGGNVVYTLSVASPSGYNPTVIDVNSNGNDKEDSEDPSGVVGTVTQGQSDVARLGNPNAEINGATFDFGFRLIALPVELAKFEAKLVECNVHLTWITESEENFEYFELQWSGDGQEFRTIEIVEANGGDFTQFYQFEDRAASKHNYYRIKMVDLDKSIDYSKVIYQNTNCSASEEVVIFPNPLSPIDGFLNVRFFAERSEAQILITDMLGRVVKRLVLDVEGGLKNTIQMDISDLPVGNYKLQIVGNRESKIFIISE